MYGYTEDFTAGALEWRDPLKAVMTLRDTVTGTQPVTSTARLVGLAVPILFLGLLFLGGTMGGRRR